MIERLHDVLNYDFVHEHSVVKKMPDQAIADLVGCSREAVKKHRLAYGIRKQRRKPHKHKPGDNFGLLTIRKKYRGKDKRYYCLCDCECGNEKLVELAHLISGGCISCGCAQKKITSERTWKGCGNISGSLWYAIKKSAEIRGIAFRITIDDAWALFKRQDGKCALTGEQLTFARAITGLNGLGTASLDRINSRLPYVSGNVQWVHKVINIMKNKQKEADFVIWCQKVAAYTKRRHTKR